jgi:squalene-associated FAD-dependent desaturase
VKKLTIVGAGWAGLAAAVAATQAGWQVELFEATQTAGGRARSLSQTFASAPLDNGQHILIGAYRDTLSLMRTVELNPDELLHRMPLDLRFSEGHGLHLPNWPMPFNFLAGLARARGWQWRDKASLIHAAWQWQRANFTCNETWTVAELCEHTQLSACVVTQLVEPLCLSALNISVTKASASVFLRVLQDALLGGAGSSDLLIPKVDLGGLLPEASCRWLQAHGAHIHLGKRLDASDVEALYAHATVNQPILLACPAWEAARLSAAIAPTWAHQASELPHTAIATVYLHCKDAGYVGLPRPMVALDSHAQAPAQFVFDRGALMGQPGLLAAVVSACDLDRDALNTHVHRQVSEQLGLSQLTWVQTVVEKRATFACTPQIDRPDSFIADKLWACGDYIRGPYPATLEGAVRSGQQVVAQLTHVAHGERLW